jgi:small-conductance mechanosensitive channel
LEATAVVEFLDATIDWYRSLHLTAQASDEPSDVLLSEENRRTAGNTLTAAFDFARADAAMLAAAPRSAPVGGQGTAAAQLVATQQRLDEQLRTLRERLQRERQAGKSGGGRDALHQKALLAALGGELELTEARKSLVDTLFTTMNVGDASTLSPEALQAQIAAMSFALPITANNGLSAASTPASVAASAAATASGNSTRFGVWQWGAKAFDLVSKQNEIVASDRATSALLARLERVRAPLIMQLKALAQSVELQQYRRNLANWLAQTKTAFRGALTALGIRLAGLEAVFIVLFLAAEFWKRLVLRYVPDARHRRQLLLVRKVILWSLVGLTVALACASEWGSIVTFAGLITAGVAVAMQSVLVSVVGYFFLIGKYGIRVGDRVQIGDVTGEVIDLGLVRMYLMELAGHGRLGPTGRVVAFANSVVFQVAGGLFKQIAGVNVAWHDLSVSLPNGIDYAKVKKRLLDAILPALSEYREEIDERVSHAVYQIINETARAQAA